jgi:hypothetical protein
MTTSTTETELRLSVHQGLACRRLMGDPEYRWKIVCKDGQRDSQGRHIGHSFWRDRDTGMVSICDQSGERPHLTDDGVLWIDDTKPWVVDDGDHVDVPLVDASGGSTRTFMTWSQGIRIARVLGAKVVVSKRSRIGMLLPLLRDLPIEK